MVVHVAKVDNSGVSEKDISEETMVFSATPQFAFDNGDEITRNVLSKLAEVDPSISFDEEQSDWVIDTRVHMLKPGWFPAIPGWHCDAVPLGDNGQPMMDHPAVSDIKHYLFILDFNTGSLTEFLEHSHFYYERMPRQADNQNLWGLHSKLIEPLDLLKKSVLSGHLYKFDAMTYHNTAPATGHGWRYFFRASYKTLSTARNQIRKQTQVYLPYEDLGW